MRSRYIELRKQRLQALLGRVLLYGERRCYEIVIVYDTVTPEINLLDHLLKLFVSHVLVALTDSRSELIQFNSS